jgi:folylpolyglutamate synthase/dihydropteroate synthase
VGIGVDKSCDNMLHKLQNLKNAKLYLTETPFKGRRIEDYPEFAKSKAVQQEAKIENILSQIKTKPQDLVVVTGSLYLVGKVLAVLN